MDNAWMIYIFVAVVLFILLYDGVKKKFLFMRMKRRKRDINMKELAQELIDKECIVYTFNNAQQFSGVIKCVSDNSIMLEKDGLKQIVNLEYVISIREHPLNKKGKKKAIIW